MKIGIDLGGSHIGIGVIQDETIIEKFEKDFSNEDKSNLTEFLRDNSNSKLRVALVGADSRVINGKSFFPENMIVSEQKKYIFNALEVSAAIESLNY